MRSPTLGVPEAGDKIVLALAEVLTVGVSLGGTGHGVPITSSCLCSRCRPALRRRRSSCLWRGDTSSSQAAGASPKCPQLSER